MMPCLLAFFSLPFLILSVKTRKQLWRMLLRAIFKSHGGFQSILKSKLSVMATQPGNRFLEVKRNKEWTVCVVRQRGIGIDKNGSVMTLSTQCFHVCLWATRCPWAAVSAAWPSSMMAPVWNSLQRVPKFMVCSHCLPCLSRRLCILLACLLCSLLKFHKRNSFFL